jgi:hypothetical protein
MTRFRLGGRLACEMRHQFPRYITALTIHRHVSMTHHICDPSELKARQQCLITLLPNACIVIDLAAVPPPDRGMSAFTTVTQLMHRDQF